MEKWNGIPVEACQKLVESMSRRIQAVIRAKGGHIDYLLHLYHLDYRGSKNCPNDRVFYFVYCYANFDPNHMTVGLF